MHTLYEKYKVRHPKYCYYLLLLFIAFMRIILTFLIYCDCSYDGHCGHYTTMTLVFMIDLKYCNSWLM